MCRHDGWSRSGPGGKALGVKASKSKEARGEWMEGRRWGPSPHRRGQRGLSCSVLSAVSRDWRFIPGALSKRVTLSDGSGVPGLWLNHCRTRLGGRGDSGKWANLRAA